VLREILRRMVRCPAKDQERSKEYCQDRDMFFAGVSHEIRTPVNGIAGFTQLLKETQLTEEQDQLVDTIHSSSTHLLELINDILDFSKINANSLVLEEISFNLFRQIEDTVETHALMASQKDVELGLYIDPQIPQALMGDPTKISQVMINLVANAIKFTDSFGRVNIEIEKLQQTEEETVLKFSVSDTGIGIGEEEQARIFNPFSQASSAISKKFGGTGLGLAISSKLVALMGGRLEVESILEEGSCFYFELTFKNASIEESISYKDKYVGSKIGLLLPNREVDREIDTYLQRYIRYLGADFDILFADEILGKRSLKLPDILFVDQRYTRRENELDQVLSLDTKIVLMTTATIKKEYIVDPKEVDKIIFKPVNLTKLMRALESTTSSSTEEVHRIDQEKFPGIHILVAEDNQVNQKLMQRILEKLDVHVTIASNGEEAFSLYQQNSFDMLFMDIQMPIMDGPTSCRAIRRYEEEQDEEKHIPIVALTGNTLSKDIEGYLDSGMDTHISKPINIKEIIDVIKAYTVVEDEAIEPTVNIVKAFHYKNVHALIVEDNTINQKLIERVLVSMGITAEIASNGSIGVKYYQEKAFDIIFMGTKMPVLNGMEAIKKIIAFEKKHLLVHAPIIMLLPEGMSDEEKRTYTYIGADNYVHKPIDIDEIKFQVERYLKDKKTKVEHVSPKEMIMQNENDCDRRSLDSVEELMVDPVDEEIEKETVIEDMIYSDPSKERSPVENEDPLSSSVLNEEEVNKEEETQEEELPVSKELQEDPTEDEAQKSAVPVSQYEIKYIDIPLSRS